MRKILDRILGRTLAPEPDREPDMTLEPVAEGYESEFPMLPKGIVHMAVDGGWQGFHGSLGPEFILDLEFFRSLTKSMLKAGIRPPHNSLDLAHLTYDFYLGKHTKPEQVNAFWADLLSPP